MHTGQMGARCQVCISADIVAIHEALLAGVARRRVARNFGLDHSAMDRHWKLHMPAQMRAASARAQDARGPVTIDALSGDVLVGLAAEQYERSEALLDRLEQQMSIPGAKVDTRSVVAALREVRQSVETLAKLSFAVQDRPQRAAESESPAIDAAIMAALRARDVAVDEPAPESPSVHRVLELGPGTE